MLYNCICGSDRMKRAFPILTMVWVNRKNHRGHLFEDLTVNAKISQVNNYLFFLVINSFEAYWSPDGSYDNPLSLGVGWLKGPEESHFLNVPTEKGKNLTD